MTGTKRQSYSLVNDDQTLSEMNLGIKCALSGYKISCHGQLENHHIINKSMARGCPELRKLLATCPRELMALVCQRHNMGRWADHTEARRMLLAYNSKRYGTQRVRRAYEAAIGLLKQPPPEWRWEAVVDD